MWSTGVSVPLQISTPITSSMSPTCITSHFLRFHANIVRSFRHLKISWKMPNPSSELWQINCSSSTDTHPLLRLTCNRSFEHSNGIHRDKSIALFHPSLPWPDPCPTCLLQLFFKTNIYLFFNTNNTIFRTLRQLHFIDCKCIFYTSHCLLTFSKVSHILLQRAIRFRLEYTPSACSACVSFQRPLSMQHF